MKMKIFILVAALLLISWFVPIIPKYNPTGYGIPGCKLIEFRDLKYFVYDEYMYNPSGKHQDPPKIPLGGMWDCSIIN